MRTFNSVAEIRAERAQLRENQVLYRLLGTIIGELDRQGGKSDNASAEDIYKILKKLYEANLAYGIENMPDDVAEEFRYLSQFQRVKLEGQALYERIEGAYLDGTLKKEGGMKAAMAWLKETLPGQYDGKEASSIIKFILDTGLHNIDAYYSSIKAG